MKTLNSILCTLTLTLGLTLSALAQDTTPAPTPTPKQRGTKTPVINQRQDNQKTRVKRCVRSGELTAKETGKLANEVQENKEMKQEAKADGSVTRAERKEIQKEQNQTSRQIYKAKHNNRKRN
jgi:hypothetical protein